MGDGEPMDFEVPASALSGIERGSGEWQSVQRCVRETLLSLISTGGAKPCAPRTLLSLRPALSAAETERAEEEEEEEDERKIETERAGSAERYRNTERTIAAEREVSAALISPHVHSIGEPKLLPDRRVYFGHTQSHFSPLRVSFPNRSSSPPKRKPPQCGSSSSSNNNKSRRLAPFHADEPTVKRTECVRHRRDVSCALLNAHEDISRLRADAETALIKAARDAMRVDPRRAKEILGEVRPLAQPTREQQKALAAYSDALAALEEAARELVATFLSQEEMRFLGVNTHKFQTRAQRCTAYQYAPQRIVGAKPQQQRNARQTALREEWDEEEEEIDSERERERERKKKEREREEKERKVEMEREKMRKEREEREREMEMEREGEKMKKEREREEREKEVEMERERMKKEKDERERMKRKKERAEREREREKMQREKEKEERGREEVEKEGEREEREREKIKRKTEREREKMQMGKEREETEKETEKEKERVREKRREGSRRKHQERSESSRRRTPAAASATKRQTAATEHTKSDALQSPMTPQHAAEKHIDFLPPSPEKKRATFSELDRLAKKPPRVSSIVPPVATAPREVPAAHPKERDAQSDERVREKDNQKETPQQPVIEVPTGAPLVAAPAEPPRAGLRHLELKRFLIDSDSDSSG